MMHTLVLVRHGRSTANAAGVLAGRSQGVDLDEVGRSQAVALADRLGVVPVARLVSSPQARCRQTLAPLADRLGLEPAIDPGLDEVDYGSWTGRRLGELVAEPLWHAVQQHPAAAMFPDGESLAGMSARAVQAVRRQAADLAPGSVLVVCTHGDVIKAVVADALGLHLDGFQRIVVAPASVSVIRYTDLRPFVERLNDNGDLTALRPPADVTTAGGADAVPGGATG